MKNEQNNENNNSVRGFQLPFFSLLIPSFNSAKTILDCLSSVLDQTFMDFEVIIVDDSTDETIDLVNSLQSKKISIVRQKGKGIMDARRELLFLAKGSYVFFLDSDDRLSSKTVLNRVFDEINLTDCDVVLFDYVIEYKGIQKMVDKPLPHFEEGWIKPDLFLGNLVASDALNSLWNKVIRRTLLLSSFPKSSIVGFGEDRLVLFYLSLTTPSIRFIATPLYVYRIFDGSATRKFSPSYLNDLSLSSRCLEKALKENNRDDLLPSLYHYYLRNYIAYTRSILCSNSSRENVLLLKKIVESRKSDPIWTEANLALHRHDFAFRGRDRLQLFLIERKEFALLMFLSKVYSVTRQ